MKMKTVFTFFLALILGSLVFAQPMVSPLKSSVAPAGTSEVNWVSWEEAMALMEKEPRKIMVDVYTSWCGWCKRMDATTMQDPVVVQLLNEQYYAVKMDGEYKKDIAFRGRTYQFVPNGRRGYHELPAELMNGKMSYPTLVFLDENYNVIQPLPGYKSTADLEPILAYFGGDYYRSTSWDKFQGEYKSPR